MPLDAYEVVVGTAQPLRLRGLQRSAQAGLTTFALQAKPRTNRSQSMDALFRQVDASIIVGTNGVVNPFSLQ